METSSSGNEVNYTDTHELNTINGNNKNNFINYDGEGSGSDNGYEDEEGLLNNVLNHNDDEAYSTSFDFEIHSIPLSLSQVKQKNQEIERHVTLFQGINLIIGLMIGSGIFASPGPVLKYSGSVGMSLIVWFTAGCLALTGALCYAELGTMIPSSGGEYQYLNVSFGSLVSFLFSWTAILVQKPGSLSIICVVFADYICKMFTYSNGSDENLPSRREVDDQIPVTEDVSDDVNPWMSRIVAILCIFLLTIINSLSSKLSKMTQNIFTVLKLIALVAIGFIGVVVLFTGPMTDNFDNMFKSSSVNPGSYALALYSALWAYDGW